MSALKFDVLDLIREPDNYTSGERAQASEAFAELLAAAGGIEGLARLAAAPLRDYRAAVDRLTAAIARFGSAA